MTEQIARTSRRTLQNQNDLAGLRRSRTKCNSIRRATCARAHAREAKSRSWSRHARRRQNDVRRKRRQSAEVRPQCAEQMCLGQ